MGVQLFDDAQIQDRLIERFPCEEQSRAELAASVTASAAELTETLAAFFLRSGMSKDAVDSVLRHVASTMLERELSLEPNCIDVWSQLSEAISTWWQDARYLNDAGEPRELPEAGPVPSIDALLDAHVEPSLRTEAKALLQRTAAKVADGVWRLEDERGFLGVHGREAVQRLHTSFSGMLATFVDNQIRRREPPNVKNFDCMAFAQNFPVALIPEVRAKMAKRFPLVMHDVARWLTAVAAEGHDGPVATVGVTVFMQSSEPRARSADRAGVLHR